jgi:argininosuccinate synthase
MDKRIILAYSGGLDTSVAIKWLKEKCDAEVITLTVNVGQMDDFEKIRERAETLGVLKHYYLDACQEFAQNYIYPSVKANGLYEGKYPLGTALTRPLIAFKMVEIAEKENAFAVAHGCTGKGNDQVRLDVTLRTLRPNLKVIAPVREWNLSREQEVKYAQEKGIPVQKKSVYSIDQNLWGRAIESGPLENPANEPPSDVFEWVKPVSETPDQSEYVEIAFENGLPVSINGEVMNPVELISNVNEVAGLHGVGIIDHIEDRLVGIKSREVYECPAAVCIIEAHRDLEKLILTRHELFFKSYVESEWAWLVYSGLWMDPLKEDLDAFINLTQKRIAGKVKIKLYKGGYRVVSRSSRNSIYDLKMATYDTSSTFDQMAAVGFIDLWGMPTRAAKASAMEMVEGMKE